jgi:hypothetical protein
MPTGEEDAFKTDQLALSPWGSDGNTETLFARPSCKYNDYESWATPRGCNTAGNLGVTQALVDDFFMKDGRPTGKGYNDHLLGEASPLYREDRFSTTVERREQSTRWRQVQIPDQMEDAGYVTLNGTFEMYCNREPRFYVSVLYDRAWIRYGELGNRRIELFPGGKDNPAQNEVNFPEAGYLVAKKVHPEHTKSSNAETHPPRYGILYRLAEAYLSFAEALNEYDPSDPRILEYVNKIRHRAGIPLYGGGSDDVPAPVGKEAMREAIRRERRIELNCEGVRYNDIRRWKIGEVVLNKPLEGMNGTSGRQSGSFDPDDPQAFYVRTPFYNRKFKKEYYWMPLAQGYLDKNPNLVQSPYWN